MVTKPAGYASVDAPAPATPRRRGRPPGIENIALEDITAALARLNHRRVRHHLRRVVAAEMGQEERTLEAWHVRRGLTWRGFLASIYAGISGVQPPRSATDAAGMTTSRYTLDLDPDTARQLHALAVADRRDPRREAEVLVLEAIAARRHAAPMPEGKAERLPGTSTVPGLSGIHTKG